VRGVNRSARAPLRVVVERFFDPHSGERERLACGHVIHRKEDIYGPTNAYRRRCLQCLREREVSE
jgi:hypothetical protein